MFNPFPSLVPSEGTRISGEPVRPLTAQRTGPPASDRSPDAQEANILRCALERFFNVKWLGLKSSADAVRRRSIRSAHTGKALPARDARSGTDFNGESDRAGTPAARCNGLIYRRSTPADRGQWTCRGANTICAARRGDRLPADAGQRGEMICLECRGWRAAGEGRARERERAA